jgi:cytochrome P450
MKPSDASLLDPAVQQSPYAYYAALREHGVSFMPEINAYVVTRYRDVQRVLSHPEIWSNDLLGKAGFSMFRHAEAAELLAREGFARNTKLQTDPPEHRGFRALVNTSFTAGRVRASEPSLRAIVARLADALLDSRACELIARFAAPLPIHVIANRLGLPPEDAPRIKAWSDAWVEPLGFTLSLERELEVARLGLELQRYLAAHMAERERAPREDILSDLVHGTLPDGSRLSPADRMGIAEHLLVGGHETATSAIASGVLLLAQRPELADELRRTPALLPSFVEEVLRLESPSQGFFRFAVADGEVGGALIPRGAMLHVRFAAANRDSEVFPNPDALELRRPNAGAHMAFSQGEHHCIGAPLARLELRLAFAALLERTDRIALAPGFVPEYLPGLSLRTLRALHITYEPRGGGTP